MDPAGIRDALRRLQAARAAIFGGNVHLFALNPPLPVADVVQFEHAHRVELPGDYREFITTIANGGAGPYYGVFPLGQMDAIGTGLQPWQSGDGLVGALEEPFLLRGPWNDLTGMPADSPGDPDDADYERRRDAFDEAYWSASRVNGAFPVCHMGCALRVWLVVKGAEAGHLWYDWRADYRGLAPVCLKDGSRATFSSWYADWLDSALRATAPEGP